MCRRPRCPEDQYLKKAFRVEKESPGGEAHFGIVGHCAYAFKEDEEISTMAPSMELHRALVSAALEMT